MPLRTRPDVSLCVRKQVIWAERKKVEFTYIGIVEMISAGKTNEEWFVPVFSHELIQLLTDVVHLTNNAIKSKR